MVIKKLVLVLTTLLIASTALADSYLKEDNCTNFIVTPSISYRYDVFKWSIPDSYLPDKKVSELVWKNYIIQPGIKFEIEPQTNQFTFLGQVKYGHILKNQSKSWDHDWDHTRDITGNVTSKLVSTTKSQATGNILDLSGAIGYSVNLFKNNLVNFYLGYDYSDYQNKDYGAHQLVYKKKSRPSNELFAKYNFKTQAPWFGLSVDAPLNEKFTIIPTIKLYSFKYVGKGYWLGRGDLKQNPSFKDTAKGIGMGFDLDFIYKYSDNLDLTINLATKRFKMKKGKQKTFYNSLSPRGESVDNTKLLDLSLRSSAISAGLQYKL